MTVLSQAFFTLMSGNFVSFTFFSARHSSAESYMSYELKVLLTLAKGGKLSCFICIPQTIVSTSQQAWGIWVVFV